MSTTQVNTAYTGNVEVPAGVAIESYTIADGKNKGKRGVAVKFEGTGFKGIGYQAFTTLVRNAKAFEQLAALSESQLIALGDMIAFNKAQEAQKQYVGQVGAQGTIYTMPAQATNVTQQAAPAGNQDAINMALLDAIKGINARLDSFTQAAQ